MVVDDEKDILDLVLLHLEKNNFRGIGFKRSRDLLEYLQNEKPALIILDLMLPDVDGLEVCKKLKSDPQLKDIPIIMLTARDSEIDKILGLELGADDYITKPFSPRELIARVKAVLRRTQKESTETEKITIGKIITIFPEKHEVEVNGKRVDLTTTEFKILLLLAKRKGWVFSRDKILDEVWGRNIHVVDRTVDVHIKHLREKLGEAGQFIRNIRWVGYKIEDE